MCRFLLLSLVSLAGCAGAGNGTTPAPASSSPAPEAAPAADPAPTPAPREPDPSASFVMTAPVESGFKHCCGNLELKMEVQCGDRLKRCYVRQDGRWLQTFGRHCKQELGASCYLHTCDEVCSLD